MSSSAAPSGPIAVRIREKLADAFAPQYLDVINESYMHNVPKGAETHFKVTSLALRWSSSWTSNQLTLMCTYTGRRSDGAV
jgi:hypothetical protein